MPHQQLVKQVIIAPHVQDYAIRMRAGDASAGNFCGADDEPIYPRGSQPAAGPGDHAGAARCGRCSMADSM